VGEFSYVFLDGLSLKRSWGGEVKNISVLVAIGVAQNGYWEILVVSEGAKEDKASWTQFLRELKGRELKGVELFVSDKCLGLVDTSRVLPRCEVAALRGALLPQRVDRSANR
jgi:putative transposase